MGMGRHASRKASKRIATSSTGKSGTAGDSDLEDCDKSSDNDWNEKPVLKKPRKKRTDRPPVTAASSSASANTSSNGQTGVSNRKVGQNRREGTTVLLRNANGQFTSAAALAANGSTSDRQSDRKTDLKIDAQEFQF